MYKTLRALLLIELFLVNMAVGQVVSDLSQEECNEAQEVNASSAEVVPTPVFDIEDAVVYKGVPLRPFGPLPNFDEGWPPIDLASVARLYQDETGRFYHLPPGILPSAADPSDFQSNPLIQQPNLGVASQPVLLKALLNPTNTPYDETFPTMSFGLQGRPGVYYDTGAFDGSGQAAFYPGNIALNATQAALQRGQITFKQIPTTLTTVPARWQTGLQSSNILGLDQLQGYVDAIYVNNTSLRGRSVYVRAERNNNGLLVGKAETAFGDLGSAPMIVASGGVPVGAVGINQMAGASFNGVDQVRYTRYWDSGFWETTGSLEQGPTGDVSDQSSGSVLRNLPSFVARARYSPSADQFDSFQIASLIRPIGFNAPNFTSHTATGWGVSGTMRFANAARTDAIYAGVVGGRGIGGYIFGSLQAATLSEMLSLQTLSNFGTYVAYQHVWTKTATANLASNLAYGYVLSGTALPTDNRELQQAWGNLLWNMTTNSAVGLEYQYGNRRVQDGNRGDDHRILFVAQLQAVPGKNRYYGGPTRTTQTLDSYGRPTRALGFRRL